jgi:hypothetical protein
MCSVFWSLSPAGPVAQPHAGGHDHHAGAHADLAAIGLNDRAVHLAVALRVIS